jgi:hypothetical protein
MNTGIHDRTRCAATFRGSDTWVVLHVAQTKRIASATKFIYCRLFSHPNKAFSDLELRDARGWSIFQTSAKAQNSLNCSRQEYGTGHDRLASNSTPIMLHAAHMFEGVSVFDSPIYTSSTKLIVGVSSLNGKWYFLSRLKIAKRVISTSRKICAVCGAKVTTRSLVAVRRPIP